MEKVLAIAVHPDDETLGCGGTLLKHYNNGDEVYWLIITKANQKITSIPEIEKEQTRYIKQVANAYRFKKWAQLSFLTTELDQYPLGELIKSISDFIIDIKPSVIYFNNFSDIHSDHKIAFNAIYSCTKNFRYPFIQRILLFEVLSETEFAPALQSNAFIPNVFVDITPFLEQKLEIMKLFTTEQMDEPFPRALSTIRALSRYRGSRIGVEYAEAFMLLFESA
jgi:N-acetylglucosamine malate deacetylase 1